MAVTKRTLFPILGIFTALIFASTPPAILAEESEEMTTGTVPEALVLEPPQITTPGLVRWIGDPLQHPDGEVHEMWWVQDGSRCYLHTGLDNRRQLWRTSAGGAQLKLESYLPLDDGFAASGDGRWLLGTQQNFHMKDGKRPRETLRLYHADSLQGVWEIPLDKFGAFNDISFTSDGKYIVIVNQNQIPNGYVLSILDTETGRRLKKITRTWPAPTPGTFYETPGRSEVCVSKDTVLLPQIYDDQHRITRLFLQTMQIVPVTEPLNDEWWRATICHSPDGRWMALAKSPSYSIWEWTGERYVERFRGEVPIYSEGYNIVSDYIKSLCFSPDSNLLLVSARFKHKVIRLSDRQIMHESATEGMYGRFSPDGRIFWRFGQGFQAWDAATWQEQNQLTPGPRYRPQNMGFSPSGFRLLMSDRFGAEIWEINGDRPLARLATPHDTSFSSTVWSASGNEIYGGNESQYLRWKLPSSFLKGVTQQIKGETLFEMAPVFQTMEPAEKRKYIPYIGAVDRSTDTCLLMVYRSPASTQFRNPKQPAVIHHFTVPKGQRSPTEGGFFGAGGKEFYYAAEPRPGVDPPTTLPPGVSITGGSFSTDERVIFAYDLETANLRQTKDPNLMGLLVGYDSKKRQLVTLSEYHGINILDAGTLAGVKDYQTGRGISFHKPVTLSPDGHWLFCVLKESGVDKFALVDLEQGKLAALIPQGDIPVENAEFSADSAFMALAHRNGCISIWRVADMAATLPAPTMPLSSRAVQLSAASATPAPVTRTFKGGATGKGLMPPFPLIVGGVTWKFDELGCLTSADPAVNIGQLLINDQPLQSVEQRFRFITASAQSPADQFTAMRDAGGKFLVRRTMHATVQGSCTLTDEVHNMSETPQFLKISFISNLGGDLPALRCEDGKSPTVNGNSLVLGGNKNYVGAQLPEAGERRAQAIGVLLSTPSAPQSPMLRWDADRKAVVSEWTITLPPFQSRFLVHQVTQQPMNTPESLAKMLVIYRHMGLAAGLKGGLAAKLLNGAVENYDEGIWQMMNQASGMGKDGRQKDALGFQWRYLDIFDGMESEIGPSQLLPLWVNGSPTHFTSLVNLEAEADPRHFSGVSAGGPIGVPLSVQRRLLLSTEDGCLITHDTLTNGTEEAVTTTVDLPIVSQTKIESVVDADGRKLDLSHPVAGNDCGGWISVVCSGADKPGVVVAIGSKDATLLPSIVRRGDNAIFLHYEITVKPREKISVAHLVAPRPLSAFDTPAAARAGLKTPMEFARFQLPAVPSASNWPPRKP